MQDLAALALPGAGFDAAIGVQSIHHLTPDEKQALFRTVAGSATPRRAIRPLRSRYVNSRRPVPLLSWPCGTASRRQHDGAPALPGYGYAEHLYALRARGDLPDTVEEQVAWLREAGFGAAGCFYRYVERAIFGGLKGPDAPAPPLPIPPWSPNSTPRWRPGGAALAQAQSVEKAKISIMPQQEVNGVHLHYEDVGTGSPVLLLHNAFGTGRSVFNGLIEFLAERGHRVIAPDLRGYGHSRPRAAIFRPTIISAIWPTWPPCCKRSTRPRRMWWGYPMERSWACCWRSPTLNRCDPYSPGPRTPISRWRNAASTCN